MSALGRYKLRLKRKKYLLRAQRKGRQLVCVADRTSKIRKTDVLCFVTLRNEKVRLKYFLEYYRERGVSHFFFVDNQSNDGTREMLAQQPDCSVWSTDASYKRSRFGIDWQNYLLRHYADGHWCLVVDPDEFLVYPFYDTRPIPALTDWLDASSVKSFGAMLLDMYPKGPIDAQTYQDGENPFNIACWFDSGNYTIQRNWDYGNLWIQGGFKVVRVRGLSLPKTPNGRLR